MATCHTLPAIRYLPTYGLPPSAILRYTTVAMRRASPNLTTIVVLFVTLRLTLLVLFTPQGLLNAFTDYHFYFRTAEYARQGYYPFINMWYEYPPLVTYLVQAVYNFAQSIVPGDVESFSFVLFVRLLGMPLLLFEGNK